MCSVSVVEDGDAVTVEVDAIADKDLLVSRCSVAKSNDPSSIFAERSIPCSSRYPNSGRGKSQEWLANAVEAS